MKKSTADIKAEFNRSKEYGIMQYEDEKKYLIGFMAEYEDDTRSAVSSILNQAKKRIDAIDAEIDRVMKMTEMEKKHEDCQFICGIDEVGRGPFAGPVVAGAVVLPKGMIIPYLNDSKQVKAERRKELAEIIKENAISYGIGVSSEKIIDEVGIVEANHMAMRQAIASLKVEPDYLLIDAVHLPDVSMRQTGIIKGDTISVSIAAASIIAKVYRDELMELYDELYPEYKFAKNVGYGTKEHIEAIKKYGPCEIHRRTFIKNYYQE